MKKASLVAFLLLVAGCGTSSSSGSAALVGATAPSATTPTTAAQTATVGLELEVDAPSWSGSAIYAALSVPVNGKPAWTADAVKLTKDARGRFRAHVDVPMGETVKWKLTRGSWATVEKGIRGENVPDRVAPSGYAFAHVFHWGGDGIFDPQSPRLLDMGNWKPAMLRARRVFVHLPMGYETVKNHRWPVLYALDGQNLFDPGRAFGGQTWRMGEAADRHEASGKTGFIIVAIDNTPERADEYCPSFDPRYGGGRLDELAWFIFEEVKGEIDRLFRTNPSADATGIIGSSLGGLAAMNVGWRYPDRVRRVGAVSPSFWWNGEETKRTLQGATAKRPLRVWIDMGTREGNDNAFYLQTARDVAFSLVNLGFQWDKDLRHREYPGAGHNEAAWAARLPDVLAWLYP